ncbi:MAG: BREX-1 system adenine-specific DNA-methyltransferase PglX, partial [Burkholderiaceae bacterium]|nr:BREX-1 system adenine-specific DNA-methyltransferase PglX [Burkholderiaceae bacterium]
MNKAKLKSYAPQARKDFIAAVAARANLLGLSEKAGALDVAPSQPQGDVTVLAGQAWPAKVHTQRDQLVARIRKDGFAQTMEAIAYTWFNRFAALRYMELHDYLGHGHRALSSTSGGLPDILTHATDLTNELPGLNAAKVTELKLAGNRDGELYRMLLVAQCNALSRAMPFLFERIDDDSELLLPDNLLRSDSVIAKLVAEIPEEDWAEVEIIGWLYQFYISEKKDQVIGKVVKSEDIPAATQLFTPNWIVQYLVQNSVGRLWLMANPQSTLAREWPYYITPAEQTPEVQAQLDALIQTRVREDGDTLNPESITVLDPACGSGHILVVAYDVLKAIYLERGYQPRAIPRLILEKNLYGLDIDDRAAQMAGFALLMKARADDRRLFSEPIRLNVLALQESRGLDVDSLLHALQDTVGRVSPQGVTRHPAGSFADHDLFPGTRPQMSLGEGGDASLPLPLGEGWGEGGLRATINALVETFEHAKTFGSLIQIPEALKTHLA